MAYKRYPLISTFKGWSFANIVSNLYNTRFTDSPTESSVPSGYSDDPMMCVNNGLVINFFRKYDVGARLTVWGNDYRGIGIDGELAGGVTIDDLDES